MTELLTAEEVAGILRCTERYVWRLGRDGKLPRVLVGRKVLFDPADVAAFIQAAKDGPRPQARIETSSRSKRSPNRRRF